MKFRTVIEVICDASDADEAGNIAGEYLRGKEDSGIQMNSKTNLLSGYRVKKYAVRSLLVFLVVFAIMAGSGLPINNGTVNSSAGLTNTTTYTVQPELKTSYDSELRADWHDKEDEVIREYLK